MKFKKLLGVGLSMAMLFNTAGLANAQTIDEASVAETTGAITVEAEAETAAETAAEEAEAEAAAETEEAVTEEEAAALGEDIPNITAKYIPGTSPIEKSYNEKFEYVTGFAAAGVSDRTKYLNTSYHKVVSTPREFLDALNGAKDGEVKIIEVTKDLDFGYKSLDFSAEEKTKYSCVSQYPTPVANYSMSGFTEMTGFTNPDMYESGVSKMSLSGIDGLTIFSTNGASFSHVETKLNRGANDIVIRNIHFKDMWQWDDNEDQKACGWSNLKINGATNVWIDHCSFDAAFDGNIDLENGARGISITWCKIGQTADEQMDSSNAIYKSIMYMESIYQANSFTNAAKSAYKKYRDKGATPQQIMAYSAYHNKCTLVGSGDKDCVDYVDSNGLNYKDANSNIRLTLAYNHIINVGQRVPMIRQGVGHLYNCYIDDSTHQKYVAMDEFKDCKYKLSRCINARNGACIGAESCVFNGINEPIIGKEIQGKDLDNMNAPFTVFFKNAYNHSLIVNSKVTNVTAPDGYVGSSWDNKGNNAFTQNFTWNDYSTLGNWAWSSTIVGNEDMVKSVLEKTAAKDAVPFEFTYGTDEKLPYSYYVMPLSEVETVVTEKAGCITDGSKTAKEWCVTHNPYEKSGAGDDTIISQPVTNSKGKVEGISFVTTDEDAKAATGGVITVNAGAKIILPGMSWKVAGCVDERISSKKDTQWTATSDAKADIALLKKYAKVKVDKKNNRTIITTVANKKVPGGVYAVKLVDENNDSFAMNIENIEFDKDIKKAIFSLSHEESTTVNELLGLDESEYTVLSVGLTLVGSKEASMFNNNSITWQVGSGKTIQTLKKGELYTVTDKKGVSIAYLTVTDEGKVKMLSGCTKGKVVLTATVNGKSYKTQVTAK